MFYMKRPPHSPRGPTRTPWSGLPSDASSLLLGICDEGDDGDDHDGEHDVDDDHWSWWWSPLHCLIKAPKVAVVLRCLHVALPKAGCSGLPWWRLSWFGWSWSWWGWSGLLWWQLAWQWWWCLNSNPPLYCKVKSKKVKFFGFFEQLLLYCTVLDLIVMIMTVNINIIININKGLQSPGCQWQSLQGWEQALFCWKPAAGGSGYRYDDDEGGDDDDDDGMMIW